MLWKKKNIKLNNNLITCKKKNVLKFNEYSSDINIIKPYNNKKFWKQVLLFLKKKKNKKKKNLYLKIKKKNKKKKNLYLKKKNKLYLKKKNKNLKKFINIFIKYYKKKACDDHILKNMTSSKKNILWYFQYRLDLVFIKIKLVSIKYIYTKEYKRICNLLLKFKNDYNKIKNSPLKKIQNKWDFLFDRNIQLLFLSYSWLSNRILEKYNLKFKNLKKIRKKNFWNLKILKKFKKIKKKRYKIENKASELFKKMFEITVPQYLKSLKYKNNTWNNANAWQNNYEKVNNQWNNKIGKHRYYRRRKQYNIQWAVMRYKYRQLAKYKNRRNLYGLFANVKSAFKGKLSFLNKLVIDKKKTKKFFGWSKNPYYYLVYGLWAKPTRYPFNRETQYLWNRDCFKENFSEKKKRKYYLKIGRKRCFDSKTMKAYIHYNEKKNKKFNDLIATRRSPNQYYKRRFIHFKILNPKRFWERTYPAWFVRRRDRDFISLDKWINELNRDSLYLFKCGNIIQWEKKRTYPNENKAVYINIGNRKHLFIISKNDVVDKKMWTSYDIFTNKWIKWFNSYKDPIFFRNFIKAEKIKKKLNYKDIDDDCTLTVRQKEAKKGKFFKKIYGIADRRRYKYTVIQMYPYGININKKFIEIISFFTRKVYKLLLTKKNKLKLYLTKKVILKKKPYMVKNRNRWKRELRLLLKNLLNNIWTINNVKILKKKIKYNYICYNILRLNCKSKLHWKKRGFAKSFLQTFEKIFKYNRLKFLSDKLSNKNLLKYYKLYNLYFFWFLYNYKKTATVYIKLLFNMWLRFFYILKNNLNQKIFKLFFKYSKKNKIYNNNKEFEYIWIMKYLNILYNENIFLVNNHFIFVIHRLIITYNFNNSLKNLYFYLSRKNIKNIKTKPNLLDIFYNRIYKCNKSYNKLYKYLPRLMRYYRDITHLQQQRRNRWLRRKKQRLRERRLRYYNWAHKKCKKVSNLYNWDLTW